MKAFGLAFLLFILAPVLTGTSALCGDIPLIDAHSQMARGLDESKIIPLMDKAGVRVTLLSARNDRDPSEVLAFAAKHPDRIIPMVRTKGKAFNHNKPKFYELMEKQLVMPQFKGMAEVLLYHAQKGNKAPEIAVFPDDPQADFSLETCRERGWPFIAHIEFKASKGKRSTFMKKLKAMLDANPDHPFVLIHMGQLEPDDAARLLKAHGNLHFMTSHCNPVSIKGGGQPWINMFKGKSIAPKWQALMKQYPDRFVLAFDNVWPEFWGDFYLDQARLWQKALSELPPDVAHAVAHGNAERLWKLKPMR